MTESIIENKSLIAKFVERTNMDEEQAVKFMNAAFREIIDNLQEGKSVCLSGFGDFRIKKVNERIVVDPETKVRTLFPPKIILSYEKSKTLTDKVEAFGKL